MLESELESNNDTDNERKLATMIRQFHKRFDAKKFKLKPESFSVSVDVTVDDFVDIKHKLNNVLISEILLNMNDVTTAHKLQGRPKINLL